MDAGLIALITAFAPALAVLFLVTLAAGVVLLKLDADKILALLNSSASLLLLAAFLFCIVLVTHLFQKADWTADLLKVLAGVLVGAAGGLTKKDSAVNPSGGAQSIQGDNNIQAMGDVIKELQGDIQGLKDSVINQTQTINQVAEAGARSPVSPILKPFFMRFETDDTQFLLDLEFRVKTPIKDQWQDWIEACMSRPDIGGRLHEEIRQLERAGWHVESLVLDSVEKGISVIFNATKPVNTYA